MKVKEEITIELTAAEASIILKNHFSDKYDIDNVHFDICTVYAHDMHGCGSEEVTKVRLVGKNKQKVVSLSEDLGPEYDSAGFTEDDRIVNG
jgi:hypothetical protein